MTIRHASVADASLLAEHRAAVWREVSGWSVSEIREVLPAWTTFLAGHLAGGTYVARVAERDGRAIGTAGFLIHAAMPRPHLDSERAGRVQSVYVVPDARRTGVALAMMKLLLEDARAANLISLSLRPSDEARALYGAVGFSSADEMMLKLTD